VAQKNLPRQQYVSKEPVDVAFHSDEQYDYARGVYEKGFGKRDYRPARHVREVVFLKKAGLFVVRDTLESLDGKPHSYQALFHLGAQSVDVDREHGIVYKLDIKEIMFSKGNLNERKRIVKQIKKSETIVDMFAGIGYFCLGIAKFSEAKKIYAIEINPKSYEYLLENIRINKVGSKIIPILGDSAVEIMKLGRIADRVIMGLLPSCKEYLKDAMKVVKPNRIIHYHGIAKKGDKKLFEDVETAARSEGRKTRLIKKTKVKSYAPKVYHFVLDCKII